MADQRQTDEERVRLLLSAAAESDEPPVVPGAEFTAHARRQLLRRRLAMAGSGAAALGVAVVVTLGTGILSSGDDPVPAASAGCVRDVAAQIRERQEEGYRPVYGSLREGRIPTDDGVTRSSAFRFTVDGALSGDADTGVPSTGDVNVWYPVSASELPEPGRYVLLLEQAARPSKAGEPLFEMAPRQVLPLADDGRLTLRCPDGAEGAVQQERLRAELESS
ncbi:hypothetical protein [Streptomyces chartreusis]